MVGMIFRLEIAIGNEDMRSAHDIALALREVAAQIAPGNAAGLIRDVNGNRVGSWSIAEDAAL